LSCLRRSEALLPPLRRDSREVERAPSDQAGGWKDRGVGELEGMLEGRAGRLAQPMEAVRDSRLSSALEVEFELGDSRNTGLYSEVAGSDSGGGAAAVVVADGLNAFLLAVVLRLRCD
jgi:hypothetical protein